MERNERKHETRRTVYVLQGELKDSMQRQAPGDCAQLLRHHRVAALHHGRQRPRSVTANVFTNQGSFVIRAAVMLSWASMRTSYYMVHFAGHLSYHIPANGHGAFVPSVGVHAFKFKISVHIFRRTREHPSENRLGPVYSKGIGRGKGGCRRE